MQYREIYKALEHHWKVTPGMRWMDFSGWRQPNSALGRHAALLLVVEDPAAIITALLTLYGARAFNPAAVRW